MGVREEEDQVVTACNVAARAAARYARRVFWADPDDLEQSAIVATLEARATFDPNVGVPFAAYAWRAAVLACRRWCWANTAPVNETDHKVRELSGVHRAELCDELVDPAPWADALLIDADWQFRVHEQLDFVLRSRQGDMSSVSLRILLDDEHPRDVADDLGLSRAAVYRLAQVARQVLGRNALLFDLLKETSA